MIEAMSETLKAMPERLVHDLNPLVANPWAPFETSAFLDSFSPSLMPRSSLHQGLAIGLNVLSARAVGRLVERLTGAVLPKNATLGDRLVARGGLAIAGVVASKLAAQKAQNKWRATFYSGGEILKSAAIGGAIFDVASAGARRYKPRKTFEPVLASVLVGAGLLYFAKRRLDHRRVEIQRWPVRQENTLARSVGIGATVAAVGQLIAKGVGRSRKDLIAYLGDGWSKRVLGSVANGGIWALGVTTVYQLAISKIGRDNEVVDPGYSVPPASKYVSGSPASTVPFEDLGREGRRFVSDVVTPKLIKTVLGEDAKAHPIRVFIGFNSEPIYQTGRVELALEELERTGAFNKKFLVLVSPTGRGWVDHTMAEATEFLSRGDVATVCIQYGKYPSPLCIQKVPLGRSQFRLLLWGIRQRLNGVPKSKRPKVFVFGESLGAWAASDVLMYQGIKGFDHYGIDKALWVGLPGLAKWSRNGMERGSNSLVGPEQVTVVDDPNELEQLGAARRKMLRAVILSHDNDPIAALSPDLILQKPHWLKGARGRNVPPDMYWEPIVTFWQTAVDAANAMQTIPGDFRSFGHDYRQDMLTAVRFGFEMPAVTKKQMSAIDSMLRQLELERQTRIDAVSPEDAPLAPVAQEAHDQGEFLGGVPLRQRRTRGARWIGSLISRRSPSSMSARRPVASKKQPA